jgi:GMP synthase (glutamine-hydrolysing)
MILIIKHALDEGPGLLENYFLAKKINFWVLEFEKGEKIPDSFDGIDAIISLGGPMNVYQENEYPFLKDEDIMLKKAFSLNIPVLGICLGAQLMAKALGAAVKKAKEKEIGWKTVGLNCRGIIDPLFAGVDSVLEVFQWHEDMFEVPKKGVLLADNTVCPQTFKYGNRSYAFQFHIEVTPKLIEKWMETESSKKDQLKIIDRAFSKKDDYIRQMNTILNNYMNIIGVRV